MCGLPEIFNSIVLSLPDRTPRSDIIVGNRGDDIDVNIPKRNLKKNSTQIMQISYLDMQTCN